jgi:hypothetical protein
VSDEGLKALATVLGPTFAALLTGGALLFQNSLNSKREQERRREARADDAARALVAARTEWAAAFQEAHLGAMTAVHAWHNIPVGEHYSERAQEARDAWLTSYERALVATARLLVIEQDEWIRHTANALAVSVEPVPKMGETDANRGVAATRELERMRNLKSAFMSFIRIVAGAGGPDDLKRLAEDFEKACSRILSPEIRQKLVSKMSARGAMGELKGT